MGRCPVALDVTGQDIHGEAAGLRKQGPATQVELPGGVLAWSLNGHDAIRRVLADADVTKSARKHWPAFQEGRIRPDWELISWIAMDNMVTASGGLSIPPEWATSSSTTPAKTTHGARRHRGKIG